LNLPINNNSLLIVAICGVCAVAGGLIALTAFLVLRFTWRGALPPAVALMMRTSQNQDEVAEPYVPQPRHVDLRARAEAMNFDEAVAKYSHGQTTQTHPEEPAASPGVQLPPSQFDSLLGASAAPDAKSLRRRRRDAAHDEEVDDEEVFHDFLDMDEGGGE
jgi:hypothetical protein